MELNEYKINFATLESIDSNAEALLEEASQVALYTLIDNEWENSELEGPLFIYRRSKEPYYNILIMNTRSFRNRIEPVTEGFSFRLQVPFILYVNSQSSLNGMWFRRKEDCVKIYSVLTNIIKLDNIEKNVIKGSGNLNFSTIAIQCKEKFNSKTGRKVRSEHFSTADCNLKKSKPRKKSVLNFLLEATRQSRFFQVSEEIISVENSVDYSKNNSLSALSRTLSVPIAVAPSKSDVKQALQHLIVISNTSNGLVDNLEDRNTEVKLQHSPFSGFSRYIKQNPNGADYIVSKTGGSGETSGNRNLASEMGTFKKELNNNDAEFSKIQESYPPKDCAHTRLNAENLQSDAPLVKGRAFESGTTSSGNRSLSLTIRINLKQPLLPPGVFAASDGSQGLAQTSNNNIQEHCPHPLTKNQILEAVNFLLKHDAKFVKRLHEAYLKSLN